MARAKRTDRTEARRRYRAETAAIGAEPGDPSDDGEMAAAATPSRSGPGTSRGSASGAPGAPARPSILGAFRGAMRPIDLPGDIAALPTLLREWSVLLAVGVSIVGTAAFIAATNDLGASLNFALSDPLNGKSMPGVTSVAYLVISLFVTPPPAAGGFLIGFFAKRGSWLSGLLFGVVAAICYTALCLSPAGRLIVGDNSPTPFIIQGWLLGPIGAMLFASAAAWYRRFLDTVNPNRGQRPNRGQQSRGTSAAKNRPAAKSGRR